MRTYNYEVRLTNEDGSKAESVYFEGVTFEEAFNKGKIELTLQPWFGQECGFAIIPHTDGSYVPEV